MNYSMYLLETMEPDIHFVASRYHINGYEQEDLEQELRMRLWYKLSKFDHLNGAKGRTWANQVMRNHLKNLLRDETCQKRGGNYKMCSLTDNMYDKNSQMYEEIDQILDIALKNHLSLSDFI